MSYTLTLLRQRAAILRYRLLLLMLRLQMLVDIAIGGVITPYADTPHIALLIRRC